MIKKIWNKFRENEFFVFLNEGIFNIITAKNNIFYAFIYREIQEDYFDLNSLKEIELIKQALIAGNDNIYIIMAFSEDIRIMEARKLLRYLEIEKINKISKNDLRKFTIKQIEANKYSFQ